MGSRDELERFDGRGRVGDSAWACPPPLAAVTEGAAENETSGVVEEMGVDWLEGRLRRLNAGELSLLVVSGPLLLSPGWFRGTRSVVQRNRSTQAYS